MKKSALSLLLILVLAFSLLPVGAAAEEGGESTEYQQIMVNESDFTLYTKSDYPWTGSGTYTSGNAGVKNTISTLKLVVNKAGLLKFDWTVSYINRLAYFAYRIGGEYASAAEITSQSEHKYGGDEVGSESGLLVEEGDIVYFAYYKINALSNDTSVDDVASISNIRIEDYIEPDPIDYESLVVFDSTMGTVTAQWMEEKQNTNGNRYYDLSTVELTALQEGENYRLRAVAKEGYQFYGWIQTYQYNGQIKNGYKGLKYYTLTTRDPGSGVITNEKAQITVPELEAKLDGNSQYTALFAPAGTYAFRVNSSFYTDDISLAQVIDSAASGDVIEILKDIELDADATVKKGVTLYVPFRAAMGLEDEMSGKYRSCGGTANAFASSTPYVTFTVPSGKTLTVKGTLAVGSIHSSSTHSMQGHISGKYGKIENNGRITISEKGTMVSYGLVTGAGVVRAENYGVIKEPVVVCDYTGGSNSLALYTDQQMPFKRFTTQNIQCELQLERYGTLTGMITLYAIGGFNEVEADVVGVTSMSIFRPNDSGSNSNIVLSRTYSPQYLADGTWASSGIGKTTWNLYGGLTFRSLTINLGIAVVRTDHVDFAIPTHMDFIMNDGLYDIPGKLKVMPGSHMTVASDATLRINGKLIVLDGLIQGNMSSSILPTREQLSVSGYGGSGSFTLNGTLRITAGSTLGGLIQSTSDTGILIIEDGAYLKNSTEDLSVLEPGAAVDADSSIPRQTVPDSDTWVTQSGAENDLKYYNWVQQDGGKGAYSDNTTWFNLPARVYNGTEVVELTPGTWRSSVGTHTFTDVSHQRYCTNGSSIGENSAYASNGRTMTTYDESFERTVSGIWTESTAVVEITSTSVAGSATTGTATEGVEVDAIAVRNQDGSTTLTLSAVKNDQPVAEKYVFLVKYVTSSGTLTAEGSNGVFTVPAEAQSVTIESAMLGDPTGDGSVTAADLLRMKRIIVGKYTPTALESLAGDVNDDTSITAADLLRFKRFIVGKITEF